MRIKINKKILLEFLDLIMLKGTISSGKKDYLNKSTIITAINNELISENLDMTNAVYNKVTLKKVEVLNAGKIPIEDIPEFVKNIKNFKGKTLLIEFDKINIKITDGTKTGTFKVGAILSELKSVDESLIIKEKDSYKLHDLITKKYNIDEENALLKTAIDITSDELKTVTSDGDLTNNRIFPIHFSDDKLNIKVTNDYDNPDIEFINSFEIDISEGPDVKTTVSFGFDNIFNNIKGPVILYLNNDSPLVVECNNKDINFVALIAPMQEEESLEDFDEEDIDNFF